MELAERSMELKEKLRILADAAKYDVACTSSGVDRKGKKGDLGNSTAAGICHSFAADGRCISLLKILLTNHCIYDCKYCINRRSNDVERAAFTPEEVCRLTMEFYRRNYIEGLFLSSGVQRSPGDTMEQMYEVLYRLRNQYRFRGYIHVKAIPGADDVLLDAVGRLADRMSINLELPTAESLHKLAPHKSRSTILEPMKRIRDGIMEARLSQGKSPLLERAYGTDQFTAGIFKNRERLFEQGFRKCIGICGDRSIVRGFPKGMAGIRSKLGEGGNLCACGTEYSDHRGSNAGNGLSYDPDGPGPVSEL